MGSISDKSWMKRAIAIGRNGLGTTAPNPAVGAVLVKDGKLISKAFHQKAGGNHAEVDALNAAGNLARGATLYVTLEPCNHFGKTPPCTNLIISSGVSRVVIASPDPNPTVLGGGAEILKQKGIQVEVGICKEEAEFLIEPFALSFTKARPMLTLKLALTKNGKITTGRKNENWLSSSSAKAFVQRLRSRSDCIMVGKNTVIEDDPLLTNRLGRGSKPVRVYVDSKCSIRELGNLSNSAADTLSLSCVKGATVGHILCVEDESGRVDLRDGLKQLFNRGIRNILCEGGAILGASLINQDLVDLLILIKTPVIASDSGIDFSTDYRATFVLVESQRCGPDTIEFYRRR